MSWRSALWLDLLLVGDVDICTAAAPTPLLAAGNTGSVIGLVIGLVVLLTASLLLWRVQWKKQVRRQFSEYREQVVHLSDTLDALKERHKLLPFIDPDFSQPMTGATEALYQSAETALNEYRRQWLDLMDVWERGQALIESESWLGIRRYREAAKLIRAAGVDRRLEAIRQRCTEPLDRLERAHEQAQTDLAEAATLLPKLANRLNDVEQEGLPCEPYRPELESLGALVKQARGLSHNDPIGALDVLEQVRQRAAAWEKRIKDILALQRQAQEAWERLEQSATLMNRRRAEGFLLCEPGNEPLPHLDDGQDRHRAALEAIHAGDVTRAADAVTQAFASAEQAKRVVEKTVAAKSHCDATFTRRGADARRGEETLRAAQQRYLRLEREFAPDSWRGVADNMERAYALQSEAEAMLDETTALAAPHIQHYCRAAELAKKAVEQQAQASALAEAIERRLNELSELRRRCLHQIDALRHRLDSLAETLHRHTADRPIANERCEEAMRQFRQLRADADQPQPDWPSLEPKIAKAATLAEEAERSCQEDLRLAQQAADALLQAQRQLERSQEFSQFGCAADLASARRAWDDANRRLQEQEYEEATRLAGQAEQAARKALAEAERQANQKQAQLDQERGPRETPAASP